jgi:HK97 family phage prohead protease
MLKEIEQRIFKVKEFRIKTNDSDQPVLEGYSAVFDSASEDLGWGDFEIREFVDKKAFDTVLKTSDCRALFNHDINFILGRQSAGTLELEVDKTGLFSRTLLPETSYGKNLQISVERGDIKEQSFTFRVSKDVWEEDKAKKTAKRTILEIGELLDISPVTFAAYNDTTVIKRSKESLKNSFEEFRSKVNANIEDDQQVLANKAIDEKIINYLYGDQIK